ncbi:pericentriolar material 1 protein isoform X2 [Syngnathoides biaculeatus]|uniref:pericentriolar material 1 protein isoform X2 n=1 Tax=Syngnathoides biaculeatus TaxID=300417 RepID=UPI002ADDC4B5|nr:pericentriolar material 1 protein isoform X2 [Syngnathoides biaculeatus]
MATGGAPFDDSADELHNWSATNASLEDRLNNRAWGSAQQKKANRSSEKNKKKVSAAMVAESRLTNDISPHSNPWSGRRRPLHIKYTSQRSVPDQAEMDKIHQRINFSDLDESIGSDSQGRITAANNQRQLTSENKKPYNFVPLHVNTNKSKELLLPPPATSAPSTPAVAKETKKQILAAREPFSPGANAKETTTRVTGANADRLAATARADFEGGAASVDTGLLVSKLCQIREYIGKASSMRDDLVEKNDVPANVERLSHLIEHLKEQEKSYLQFLQKILARDNDDDDVRTQDSAVGSSSLIESTSLNVDVRSSDASSAPGGWPDSSMRDQKEELENFRKQHELLKKMLEQQDQLRALQGRQEALLAMQQSAEQALAVIEDAAVVTETTGSVSGLSITSELNDELNDLIQRFHNQLRDSKTKSVPDNRRQAESLSLSREVSWSRAPRVSGPPQHRPVLHSASGPHGGLDGGATAASAKLTKLQELQDKKETMDKILQELHSLRDQTLNNNYCGALSTQRSLSTGGSSDCPSAMCSNGALPAASFYPSLAPHAESANSTDKLRKLKEVHKRLNELRELVQYFQQTSDMMVDAVNENMKEDEDEEVEEEETEDSSMLEAMFDSEQENCQPPTNIRNPQCSGNWGDLNSLANRRSISSCTTANTNNHDSRLNTEINNRSAANLRSFNIPSANECQYNRDAAYNWMKDRDSHNNDGCASGGTRPGGPDDEVSGSRSSSSLTNDPGFSQEVHQQKSKQKLRQLQELVAMVQSDDTDTTTANEEEALQQRQNNTRVSLGGTPSAGPKQDPRGSDAALYSKAREKIYKEKLRQQKQALKQLHEERQMLGKIQGKIQDLQLTCPDLQSSLSSQVSEQGLVWKVPGATSTPAATQPSSSAVAKSSPAVLKPTAPEAAATSVPDNEQLWSEMRRHQIAREELRQRRKHLESLMVEHQRRSGLAESPCGTDEQAGPSLLASSRDERAMATWGSTPCNLDEDEDGDYHSEHSGEEEDSTENSSADDGHIVPAGRIHSICTNRKNQECNPEPPPGFSSEQASPRVKTKQQQPPPPRTSNQSASQPAPARRQENLCWASELSVAEGSTQWQEQISQLQRQLDFSTNMCQTLLQDQQMLSYMLQSLMTGSYNVMPNNMTSPQVHLVMHQLNQCYMQLSWQQTNVQRLKQVLNELLQQQQEPQQQNQQHLSPHPSPSAPGFSLFPLFPATVGEFPQGAINANQAGPDQQKQNLDANTSIKPEYMSFPPPLQRSPLNVTTDRQPTGWSKNTFPNNAVPHPPPPTRERLPSFSPPMFPSPQRHHNPPTEGERASEASFSSIPDCADPTTVTKTFKTGRKASAQANLASRSKTTFPKSRRKRGKGPKKNNEGLESDTLSSTAELDQERAALSRHKDQYLLDKLTQEKLNSKTKLGTKPNDISSAYAWRTPFLSNRIACTEAPDASSDFSLFEALRETIYSEVATLISQNESRPHFLIELFHELQLLNTDYLRQRALYSLQDLVTRHLAEKSTSQEMPPLAGVPWAGGSQSELTPSESSTISDAEMVEKNLKKKDDMESVGNDSTLSSTNLDPFSKDDLGNTVIHLDKALARMQQYERMKQKVHTSTAGDSDHCNVEPGASDAAVESTDGGASGDVHSPQIDTVQLNRQIKDIMTEVIPFLKENMHEVCTPQLLTSLRRKVLALTQQNDESKEFVRFFHRQLGGILQDSLSIFVGQTLKDCGEDLLVEVSDILFNELAFFRLMQDLDNGIAISPEARQNNTTKAERSPDASHTLKKTSAVEVNASDSPDEDKDKDDTEEEAISSHLPSKIKSCDDEEEEEADGGAMPVSIRGLSKAETQALNNYGSGEDENDDDEQEPEEFDAGPVDVQTSLQASAEGPAEQKGETAAEAKEGDPKLANNNAESSESSVVNSPGHEPAEVVRQNSDEGEDPVCGAVPAPEESITSSEVHTATKDSNTTSTPDTESPVMINVDEAGSGNSSQRTSDEDDFVKVDELPMQLPVKCQEELQQRILEEQQTNDLRVEILSGDAEMLPGLVGNEHHLKEPESAE